MRVINVNVAIIKQLSTLPLQQTALPTYLFSINIFVKFYVLFVVSIRYTNIVYSINFTVSASKLILIFLNTFILKYHPLNAVWALLTTKYASIKLKSSLRVVMYARWDSQSELKIRLEFSRTWKYFILRELHEIN